MADAPVEPFTRPLNPRLRPQAQPVAPSSPGAGERLFNTLSTNTGPLPPGPAVHQLRGVPHTLLGHPVAHRNSGTHLRPTALGSVAVAPPPGPIGPSEVPFIALAIPANASIITQAIVDLTNHARAENQLPPLTVNQALEEVAQLHSQDMAAANTMAHTLPGTSLATLADRAAAVHYHYQWLGENIAYNQADAASVVASWMNSPPHRENMLSPSFTDIGVGLAWNRQGEPYYTMMLGSQA
jgi:uncharacterized protein YkwD